MLAYENAHASLQMQEQQLEQAPGGVAAPAAGGGGGLDEIELSMADKIRRLVSSDEEWEAVLLQKMEEKRNRGQCTK